jgi:hypothetical protein
MRPITKEDCETIPFYGRERESRLLLEQLRLHPFMAIIGPSGIGKSSLVHAGLVPAIQSCGFFGSGEWRIVKVRPGQTPLASLIRTVDEYRLSVTEAADRAARETNPHRGQLLLIIDQFEEVFAVPQEVQDFGLAVANLVHAGRCYVVITVRADFYGDLMAVSALWPEVQDHRFELGPMDHDGLAEMIRRPAEDVGVWVEDTLVERLLADAAREPGVLPFLQETLVLMWERVQRRFLPLSAYTEMVTCTEPPINGIPLSGLHVAIARRADHTLHQLPGERERLTARRIFLRLVQFGQGRADTRAQSTVKELRSADDDPALFDATLQHLVRSRLLTTTGSADDLQAAVDIAHEALLIGWPTLSEWITLRKESEQSRRWLAELASRWLERQVLVRTEGPGRRRARRSALVE